MLDVPRWLRGRPLVACSARYIARRGPQYAVRGRLHPCAAEGKLEHLRRSATNSMLRTERMLSSTPCEDDIG